MQLFFFFSLKGLQGEKGKEEHLPFAEKIR